MKTACFIYLTAFAVGMSAATLEARPTDKSIAETRLKLGPRSSDIRYMNFNTQKQNGCSTYVDAGENRFDRMYNTIDPTNCNSPR